MSELQSGLLLLGLGVLALLWAHQTWLTWRCRRLHTQPPEAEGPARAADPVRAPSGDERPAALAPAAETPSAMLDELIDSVAGLTLEASISGDAALAAWGPSRRVGRKPLAIEGRTDPAADWQALRAGQRYVALRVGVQLANRAGALDEIEFSEFVVRTQALADALSAHVELPDMRGEVLRAAELDEFAAQHDAQLLVVLRARRVAWSPSFVQQVAAGVGFVAGSTAARMVWPSPDGAPPALISLAFDTQVALSDDPSQAALREVRLALDVPQVAQAHQPFTVLRQVSAQLAQKLDAWVGDEQGVALPDSAMDVIASELQQVYLALAAHDLAAGSPLARRLFS